MQHSGKEKNLLRYLRVLDIQVEWDEGKYLERKRGFREWTKGQRIFTGHWGG
jgi:hypothetical protein